MTHEPCALLRKCTHACMLMKLVVTTAFFLVKSAFLEEIYRRYTDEVRTLFVVFERSLTLPTSARGARPISGRPISSPAQVAGARSPSGRRVEGRRCKGKPEARSCGFPACGLGCVGRRPRGRVPRLSLNSAGRRSAPQSDRTTQTFLTASMMSQWPLQPLGSTTVSPGPQRRALPSALVRKKRPGHSGLQPRCMGLQPACTGWQPACVGWQPWVHRVAGLQPPPHTAHPPGRGSTRWSAG